MKLVVETIVDVSLPLRAGYGVRYQRGLDVAGEAGSGGSGLGLRGGVRHDVQFRQPGSSTVATELWNQTGGCWPC